MRSVAVCFGGILLRQQVIEKRRGLKTDSVKN